MTKNKLRDIAENLREELVNLSDYIYENPELGNEEIKSSQAHVDLLTAHGFEVEYPYLDIKTAFRATYDSKKEGPTIAYLSEYDALPGIGHGCGHNMLGTTDTGAGIALSKIINEIGGRVVVLGTPAEETNGAKVDMAAANTFDDIDVAIVTHPADGNYMSGTSMAMEAIAFEFFGKPAHAAAAPFDGVNALEALINMFQNINNLRQEIRPSARIQGIITHGGSAANIIPEYARGEFYIRALDKTYLAELKEKLIRCAKAGAMAAGTELKFGNYEYTNDNLITNEALSATFNENAAAVGIEMVKDERDSFGSVDMGNVSYKVPSIHPHYSITNGEKCTAHTVEFREYTKTDFAYDQMIRMVEALAGTGYDIITDKERLAEIKAEFDKIEE